MLNQFEFIISKIPFFFTAFFVLFAFGIITRIISWRKIKKLPMVRLL